MASPADRRQALAALRDELREGLRTLDTALGLPRVPRGPSWKFILGDESYNYSVHPALVAGDYNEIKKAYTSVTDKNDLPDFIESTRLFTEDEECGIFTDDDNVDNSVKIEIKDEDKNNEEDEKPVIVKVENDNPVWKKEGNESLLKLFMKHFQQMGKWILMGKISRKTLLKR